MSIREHSEQLNIKEKKTPFSILNERLGEFKKRAVQRVVTLAIIPGFALVMACEKAPVKTTDEASTETQANATVSLVNEALKHNGIKGNPDRAVTAALAGLNNPEGLTPVLRDFDVAHNKYSVPEDQAIVLSAAANINKHGRVIERVVGDYLDLKTTQGVENPAQAAGLASVATLNGVTEEEISSRFTEARGLEGISGNEAVAIVQTSYLTSTESSTNIGIGAAKDTYQKLAAHPGMSKENALLLLPAVTARGGDAESILALYDDVKKQLPDGTPPQVAADVISIAETTKEDPDRIVYMYNYIGSTGGSWADYCRSMRTAYGTSAMSNPVYAGYAVNSSYTQGLVTGHTHSPHVSIPAVSGKGGGTGAGSAISGKAGFSGGKAVSAGGGFRGGIAGGGAGASGGG